MKTKEEIQQLANDFADDAHGSPTATFLEKGFIHGYTQCQEDMVKELTEWIEVTLSAKSKLGVSDNVIEELLNVKYKIESLNKQD